MRKFFLLICFLSIPTALFASYFYDSLHGSYRYDERSLLWKDNLHTWTKDFLTGKMTYDGINTTWTYEKNRTFYKDISTQVIVTPDMIDVQKILSSFREEDGIIYYKGPNTSLIIGKDKIKYTSLGETREIDGTNWEYSNILEHYSN